MRREYIPETNLYRQTGNWSFTQPAHLLSCRHREHTQTPQITCGGSLAKESSHHEVTVLASGTISVNNSVFIWLKFFFFKKQRMLLREHEATQGYCGGVCDMCMFLSFVLSICYYYIPQADLKIVSVKYLFFFASNFQVSADACAWFFKGDINFLAWTLRFVVVTVWSSEFSLSITVYKGQSIILKLKCDFLSFKYYHQYAKVLVHLLMNRSCETSIVFLCPLHLICLVPTKVPTSFSENHQIYFFV